MEASRGELARTDPGTGRKLWTVQWSKASLDYGADGSFGGTMVGVRGALFGRSGERSLFEADRAEARQKEDWLKLSGRVRLQAQDPPSSLRCDEVLWDAAAGTVKARGGVVLETAAYSVGPFPELWATPDLTYFSTPDLFEAGRGGKERWNKR
ncbi:MAG: hypothetical protein ACK41F_09210 [Fimbriimonadaceae bacterium]